MYSRIKPNDNLIKKVELLLNKKGNKIIYINIFTPNSLQPIAESFSKIFTLCDIKVTIYIRPITNKDIDFCIKNGNYLIIFSPQTLLQTDTHIYPPYLKRLPVNKYFLYQFEDMSIPSYKNKNVNILQLINNSVCTFESSLTNIEYYPKAVQNKLLEIIPYQNTDNDNFEFYSDINNNEFINIFSIETCDILYTYIKSIEEYLIVTNPEPIITEPVIPEPVIPEPVIPEPVIPEPVIPEPVIPEPVIPEPVIPEPVIPEPVIPVPVIPVPVIPEPVIPEPVIPVPVIPEPVIPEPVIPVPVIVEPELDDKQVFKKYLLTNNIKQIYISKYLIHLKYRICKHYNLKTYNDISKPCLFFGAYTIVDFETIKYHKSFKYIMFGGPDVNNLKKINIKYNTKIISISKDIQERLNKINIKSEYINLHNDEMYQELNFNQKVGVVTSTNKLNSINNIVKNFKQQLYSNKKLFIIINNNLINIEEYKQYCEKADIEYDITFINEKYNLGYCLNFAIKKLKKQNFDIFSKFDDDDIYESNYLIEQINHVNNIDCEIVGKYNVPIFIPEYNYFYKINYLSKENIYTETCIGATITFLLKKIDIQFNEELIEGVDIDFLQNIIKNNGHIYSSSFNNYIWVRFIDNTKHTAKYNINEKYQLNKIDNTTEYYNLYMNLINHTFIKTDHLLVSVIVTMFNSENTIECCINSMINQTHKNLEIIIVDDSSKDNSVNIVKNIIETNKNIKLIENPINKGTYHCKNLGLQQINDLTEYIAFQDSDDYSHMDRIRKQVEILHLTSGKMSFSLCERISSYRMAPITQVMHIDIFKKILGYFDNNRFGADSEYYYRFMKYFNIEMKGKYTFDINSSFYKNIEGIYYVIPYLLYIINRNDENCLTNQIQLNSDKRVTYKNNYITKINELTSLYYDLN